MIYSSRLKKILHYCLTHRDQYVTLDELGELLKISKRTIFRELKDVDQDLASYQLHLDNKSGKGICIVGSSSMKDELLEELQTQGIEYINKEERTHLLTYELLHNSEITKLIHYANMFQVSEATISNDLDTMQPWFKERHVTLLRKPGLGVGVVGDEQDVRKAMSEVLHDSLQKRSYDDVNYFDSQTLLDQIFMKDGQGSIMRLLNQEILKRILYVFHEYRHELRLDRYAQSSYIGLMIHLVIAIDRIINQEEIADNEKVVSMVQEESSYEQAKTMASLLETEFDIDIPQTEIAFIALHIKGAKINNISYNDVEHEQYTMLSSIVQMMLRAYSEDIRIQLVQDEQLLHGLCTHLEPTIIRLKNQLPIYNPLLTQIKQMYQTLYLQTKQACSVLEKQFQCIVSEDEVGFITMHVGASLERAKQNKIHQRDVHIGVVCASGIGVSALLSARIQKIFPFGVRIHVLSMEDILQHRYDDCELLVSTFPITNTNVRVFCVSPLLTSEDITRIRSEVEELAKKEVVHDAVNNQDFIETIQQLQDISAAILEVLQHLYTSEIAPLQQREDMLQRIAQDHGESNTKQLYEDLLQREQMGSVIMEDYGFVLYHTKSSAITTSVVHFYYPEEDVFQEGIYKGMKFILALLHPLNHESEKQAILALLSRSIIEQDAFYEAILTKGHDAIQSKLSDCIHAYLVSYLEDHL